MATPKEPTGPATTELDTSKLVDPNKDTPIAEELEKAAKAKQKAAPKTEPEPEKSEIELALERQTDDGKGDEDPGPSDWVSYATDGVEKEDA